MIETTTRYYAAQIAERYPDLDPEGVQDLCLRFVRQVFGQVHHGNDLVFANGPRKMKIFKRDFNLARANRRASRLRHRLDKTRALQHEKENN
jgi:hypothetical protein